MAGVLTVTVTMTGWDKLQTVLNFPVNTPKLMAQIRRATTVNAMVAAREIRNNIRSGSYAPNKALTRFIKGSSKPLVDDGQLFKAITHRVLSDTHAEVGLSKGSKLANVAATLHEGTTIKVTPAMRGLFGSLASVSSGARDPSTLSGRAAELWKARPGPGWKPLKQSTTAIKIPPRPFIKDVIENPGVREMMGKNWSQAVAAGIAGTQAKLSTSV